jgi:8-oxo-dGTP pyrophosphatase MutT (NUDIX family)
MKDKLKAMEKENLKRLIKNKCGPITDRPDLSPAAVLLPLFKKNGETHILLTKRTDKVKHHKGQICFPGGAFHSEDQDLLATALRETEEEIGLEIEAIEVLGKLDQMATVSNFWVSPYVGIIPYPYPFKLNSFEVERLIELPLDYLLMKAQLKEAPFTYQGQSLVNLYLDYQGDIIWGATARILKNFMDVLA